MDEPCNVTYVVTVGNVLFVVAVPGDFAASDQAVAADRSERFSSDGDERRRAIVGELVSDQRINGLGPHSFWRRTPPIPLAMKEETMNDGWECVVLLSSFIVPSNSPVGARR